MLTYQIALTFLPGIGDITAKKLVAYCGSAEAIFREKRQNLEKIPGIGSVSADAIKSSNVLVRTEKEISFIEKNNITPLYYLDKNYPERLKNCIDSPVMLYYKGNTDLNPAKVIAVVGTRNATEYGKEITHKLLGDLKEERLLVVSGLAYGIDSVAHKASLENQIPTVAVLAHGLDRIYPLMNKNLSERILQNGGLLSDFPSKTNPDRENFPKRNRIIAGMSDAVIVVEAGARGGALITANIANSYNRDVFAVPGRLKDTFSEGCNTLIKTNRANLIQSAADVKYIMGWDRNAPQQKPLQRELFIELPKDEQTLVDILKDKGDTGIDDLCTLSQLNPTKVSSALLNLEFEDIIKSLPGKIYRLS